MKRLWKLSLKTDASRIEVSVSHLWCILLFEEGKKNHFTAAYKLLMMRRARNMRSEDEIYKACGAKKIGWESGDEESADKEFGFGASFVELQ
jgi:general transcription factor 3C polypeptide 3 (transcription factor C subunit 4)